MKPPVWLSTALLSFGVGVVNGTAIAAQDGQQLPILQVAPLRARRWRARRSRMEFRAGADRFRQTDPVEGAQASSPTLVRVFAGSGAILVGIVCEDSDPSGIVSFSVRRDATLNSEDHVRVVPGPFLDGRSGYVFAVNPSGARYDALVNPGGETDNPEWDGIWEAATRRTESGWTAEIWIPIQTLSFNPRLREWHFNVQPRALLPRL
ncbi:MAG: carbohydrate binding family 9 domain-containing protein [Acidobacteria bacterium]|nr:carbohydrate binding family 9 domain-containing protein [Acidobacteriota bacterium]